MSKAAGIAIGVCIAAFATLPAVRAETPETQRDSFGWTPPTPAQCETLPKPPDTLLTLGRCCVHDPDKIKGKPCRDEVGAPYDYVIIHDDNPKKPAGYLIIPTDEITGVDDAKVFKAPWENYWQYGRTYSHGRKRDDAKLAMAINSKPVRDQNQLHIHLACVRGDILQKLVENPIGTDPTKPTKITYGSQTYDVVKVKTLEGNDSPFNVIKQFPGKEGDMADQGIAVIGAVKKDANGKPAPDSGFFVLDTHGKQKSEGGDAEEVLDQTANCPE